VKVRTDFKAGNVYDTISAEARDVYGSVTSYLRNAEQTLEGDAQMAAQKTRQVWSCITGAFE
jgi:hypothetical protein